MFDDTGVPLQRLLDNGSTFVREASAHTDETIRLLDQGKRVLDHPAGRGREHPLPRPATCARLTDALAASDGDLEQVLDGTPGTARELDGLLRDLEPTLPVLLGNAVSVNQVVVSHLAGVEQLLVTYPITIATGFTGTPGDGYGHVNLQLDYAASRRAPSGYMPRNDWRPPSDLTDGPIYPAQCTSGPPYAMRGPTHSPGARQLLARAASTARRTTRAPGSSSGAVDADGNPVRFVDQGNLSILGGDAWKWLLVGPVTSR